MNLGIDVEAANAIGDQVGVLPAEVEDDDAQGVTSCGRGVDGGERMAENIENVSSRASAWGTKVSSRIIEQRERAKQIAGNIPIDHGYMRDDI